MRHQQNAVLTSLRQAQEFLDENDTVLGAVNTSTRKQLDDVVAQLTALSVTQNSGVHASIGETARQRALRAKLRRTCMAPIAELAKFNLRNVPEFSALRMPPTNASTQNLVAWAYAMADAAAEHAQTFMDSGLPATFADDLRTTAAAVSATVVERGKERGRHISATAGLAAEEKRGRSVLRVLNVLILAQIGHNDALVAGWAAARTVLRKPGRAAGSQPSGGAGTPATPIHLAGASGAVGTPAPASASASASTPVTSLVGEAA